VIQRSFSLRYEPATIVDQSLFSLVFGEYVGKILQKKIVQTKIATRFDWYVTKRFRRIVIFIANLIGDPRRIILPKFSPRSDHTEEPQHGGLLIDLWRECGPNM
jgi:hypothetical protein